MASSKKPEQETREPTSEEIAAQFDIKNIVPVSREELPVIEEGKLALVHSKAVEEANQMAGKDIVEEPFRAISVDEPVVVRPAAPVDVSPEGVNAQLLEVIESLRGQVDSLNRRVQQQQGRVDRVEQAADDGGETGFPWMYYKRPNMGPAAGWIVTGPGGSATPGGNRRNIGAYALYTHKGFKPLPEYGVLDPPGTDTRVGAQFRLILANGGAKEFPVAQVLAYRWHVDPPIAGLRFPQIEAVRDQIRQFACDECDFECWFIDGDRDTARACFQHLTKTHDYTRREASLTLESQSITTVAPFAVQADKA